MVATIRGPLQGVEGLGMASSASAAPPVKDRMIWLAAPAFLFVLIGFAAPILWFLSQSVDGEAIGRALPQTAAALARWDGETAPPAAAYDAMVQDLSALEDRPAVGALARELNFREPGYRTVIWRTHRALRKAGSADPGQSGLDRLLAADPAWGGVEIWRVIQREARRFTPFFLLNSLDLEQAPQGGVERKPEVERVFLSIYGRTIVIALTVTGLCALLGYPVAYLIANAAPRWGLLLLLIVLLPFWTSLLVRTLSWMVIFQRQGVLNGVLLDLGLLTDNLQLLRTRTAVYVSMVHILLPFMVLPLYSVMKKIPRTYVMAAESLGAGRLRALATVYFPQTAPGLAAGAVLVLTLALGFYITPMLLGGGGDQMVSYFVATYVNESLNWGTAAALAGWLMLFAFLCFFLINLTSRRMGGQ
ncbi:MAG: ABC transporter permease [Alphaproteobacteria bacterium]|nr:ABC transporter permease [Alphaproteobacteria bacterium]